MSNIPAEIDAVFSREFSLIADFGCLVEDIRKAQRVKQVRWSKAEKHLSVATKTNDSFQNDFGSVGLHKNAENLQICIKTLQILANSEIACKKNSKGGILAVMKAVPLDSQIGAKMSAALRFETKRSRAFKKRRFDGSCRQIRTALNRARICRWRPTCLTFDLNAVYRTFSTSSQFRRGL